MTAKIAALVLLFLPDAYDAFQPPKAAASLVIGAGVATCLVIAILRHGTGIVPSTRMHVAVATLILANLLSLAFAADRYVALAGDITRLEGVLFYLDMTVLYAAVAIAFRDERDWSVFGVGIAAISTLAMLYAVVQALGVDPIPWAGKVQERPFSTFGNADLFGHYLSVIAGASTGVALLSTRPMYRVAAVVLLVATIVVGALTGTRAFLVALAAIALAAPLVYRRAVGPLPRPGRRAVLAAGGVAMAVVALVAVTRVGARVVATFSGDATAPLRDRLIIYSSAFAAARDRPVSGWGPDNFLPAYVAHRSRESADILGPNGIQTSAHSWFFQTISTTGLLGLGALFAVIAAATFCLARTAARWPVVAGSLLLAMVGYWVHALFSIQSVSVDWLPWVAYGAAASMSGAVLPERPVGRMSNAMFAAPATAIVVAMVLAWPALAADVDAGLASREANDARRVSAAIDHAREATALDPQRARYWDRLGKTLAAANRNREAADAFAAAAARMPYNFEHWNNLGATRALQARADNDANARPAAYAAFEEGLRQDPASPTLYYTLAQVSNAFGDADRALTAIAQALSIYHLDAAYDSLAAQIVARHPDARKARVAGEQMLVSKDSDVLQLAVAVAALRAGERDIALTHVRTVLARDPRNVDAQNLERTALTAP